MRTPLGPQPLDSLFIHPLKSGEPHRVETLKLLLDGIELDRRLMVVDANAKFLTARELPTMLSIRCLPVEGGYVFTAPGMPPIEIGRTGSAELNAVVWDDGVLVRSLGDEIDAWLSRYLGRPARLVAMGEHTLRPMPVAPDRQSTFTDKSAVLLTNTASLAALNERLEHSITMQRFRPNIVVSADVPWAEDTWKRIRIGAVEFDVAEGCSRCTMTTLDPLDPQRPSIAEPLRTLSRFRKMDDGLVYFGIHIVPRNAGRIFASDRLEVLESQARPIFIGAVPAPHGLMKPQELARWGVETVPKPPQKIQLTCVAVIDETPDIRTLRFRTDPPLAGYFAGQFITLEAPLPTGSAMRSYTISSSPSRPSDISISVKRVVGGSVSHWLHEHCKVGLTLTGQGPMGHFHFQKRPGRKLLLLGAGSGMTPLISMLRWMIDLHLPIDVVLHQSCRSAGDEAFCAELKWLSSVAAHPLRVSRNLTQAHGQEGAYSGRLDPGMLGDICPDVDERIVFCCGPEGFRQSVRAILAARPHFSAANFMEEAFGGAAQPALPQPSGTTQLATKTVRIDFPDQGKSISTESSHNLLEIIRAAGLPIASSCQAGLCGTCKCQVIEGSWRLSPNNADEDMAVLSADEKSRGITLACSCRPTGDMAIRLL
ncbi:MAG: MOSC domain-containing protein [Thauera sp.]|jgi:uncharacterized protein YcbX/ferredoxin-NADP reductase|nr:MOSC domain-containing protein [Thauera sp.]